MKDEYDLRALKRGAVLETPPGKSRITIRIDNDVLDWFRARVHDAGGGNYQTLINTALRQYVAAEEQPLADLLRQVVREELERSQNGVGSPLCERE